jgi:hypothetical protein
LNSGTILFYSGTQPAAGGAVTSQVLLATLTFGATAFGASSAGVATANAITGASAVATNTVTWFRCLKSDATTIVFDGSVGTSGCDINFATTSIVSGAAVSVSALTYSIAAQGN